MLDYTPGVGSLLDLVQAQLEVLKAWWFYSISVVRLGKVAFLYFLNLFNGEWFEEVCYEKAL